MYQLSAWELKLYKNTHLNIIKLSEIEGGGSYSYLFLSNFQKCRLLARTEIGDTCPIAQNGIILEKKRFFL